MDTTVTAEMLADYIKRNGSNDEKTRAVLWRYRPFVEAINSEVGKEILKDVITNHERLLLKVADLAATPEETMEYKATQKILLKWAEKIAKYEQSLAELTK